MRTLKARLSAVAKIATNAANTASVAVAAGLLTTAGLAAASAQPQDTNARNTNAQIAKAGNEQGKAKTEGKAKPEGKASQKQDTPTTQSAPAFRFLAVPPVGLPAMPKPDGYEPSEAMFKLGRRLFHDGVLSRDRSISCSSCHPASTGFAHPGERPPGIDGQLALRHTPSLVNRGWSTRQRWDGSSPNLETFVLEPIADPREMGLQVADAVQRLQADAGYRKEFQNAFTSPPNEQNLSRALATFVRGIVSGNAPYDRFLRGEVDAMSSTERHGQWIFESKGGCWKCHTPPLFTDERFHNTGIGVLDGLAEPGHSAVTNEASDRGTFKTPSLRGVRRTAPYMHDGSLRTLPEVVEFYARGGNANEHLDRRMKPLELSDADKRALIAFLRTL